MRRPAYSSPSFNFSAMTRKIDVDNRISLRNYYRIADNLLKQASIYREEKNLIDLYVILLRYSSLVSETIPYHRDYQVLCSKERSFYKKKLLAVLDELENLKPEVRRQLDELEKVNARTPVHHVDGPDKISYASSLNNKASLGYSNKPCQTLNEEEIFEVQDKRSLFSLGWIHTHPTQTCFMSSVDLHTHYSYQVMLPEAIAIVMAPTDTSSPHGIFHLSDPGGVSVIRNCQQHGFHPHEEPEDGSPIYEHCSHVYMNEKLNFDVVDLR
ncbi:UNVERIFIED_CONTAM: AMSH-like ubiquitin thioesterase 3 [Sesamum radiatum]|uniref:AMSH-like ubiquitin thioesterase 3 n=1 Tax=Sesamum radiatum TaxID=300843 RepID=A0AAW2UDC2_SESRA